MPVERETVVADPDIAGRLPDAGLFLLDLLDFLDEPRRDAVEAAVNRLRAPDGALTGDRLRGVGARNWSAGPVTHLATLTAKDAITIEVWASFGLGRGDRRTIGQGAVAVYLRQGAAAAATWAVLSRPEARLDIGFLGEQLLGNWRELAGLISNGDIIKSFRKWKPNEG